MSKHAPDASSDQSVPNPQPPLSPVEEFFAAIDEQFRGLFAPGSNEASPNRKDPAGDSS